MKVEDLQAVLAAVDNEQGRVVVFGDTGCLDDWKRSSLLGAGRGVCGLP